MTFDNFVQLLKNLNENTSPIWGKMTAQHMIEHLVRAVQISNGKENFDICINPPEKFPVLKRILASPKPLTRNFVNYIIGEGLQPLIYENLELAKESLNIEIENFEQFFKQNPKATPMNVTFGPLNHDEWILFHNKHFTHHLMQFGLIEEK
jgi:hypothetical protein